MACPGVAKTLRTTVNFRQQNRLTINIFFKVKGQGQTGPSLIFDLQKQVGYTAT